MNEVTASPPMAACSRNDRRSSSPFRFDVHLFAIIRIKVPGIAAESMTAAIPHAIRNLPPPTLEEPLQDLLRQVRAALDATV